MNEFYVKTLEKKAIREKNGSDFIVVPHLKSCNEFFYNECYSQLKINVKWTQSSLQRGSRTIKLIHVYIHCTTCYISCYIVEAVRKITNYKKSHYTNTVIIV